MDEAPEFGPKQLQSLRTPLEEGEVRLARIDGVVRYPARFQLVMAANPCPCAPAHDRDCVCPSLARRRYLGRLSGPLLDRIDLRAHLDPVVHLAAEGGQPGESTAVARARVLAAREAAGERWGRHGWRTNAEVPGALLRGEFRLPFAAVAPPWRLLMFLEQRTGSRCVRGLRHAEHQSKCLRSPFILRARGAPLAICR